MQLPTYSLTQFISDLKQISTHHSNIPDILKLVQPLAIQLAASSDLRSRVLKEFNPEQGFGFQVLHEEADHTLAVAILTWLPGICSPPHDHGTWGVVAGIEGEETNVFWRRTDDGRTSNYAELEAIEEKMLLPGSALAFGPSDIHSIRNDSKDITVTLQIYGMNTNFTNRSQFDLADHTVKPLILVQN